MLQTQGDKIGVLDDVDVWGNSGRNAACCQIRRQREHRYLGHCSKGPKLLRQGGGSLLPTEEGHITRGMAKEHWRLSCQLKVKEDMRIRVPESVFSVKKWECEVVSNHNVATFIKEFKVRLPKGERIDFAQRRTSPSGEGGEMAGQPVDATAPVQVMAR